MCLQYSPFNSVGAQLRTDATAAALSYVKLTNLILASLKEILDNSHRNRQPHSFCCFSFMRRVRSGRGRE